MNGTEPGVPLSRRALREMRDQQARVEAAQGQAGSAAATPSADMVDAELPVLDMAPGAVAAPAEEEPAVFDEPTDSAPSPTEVVTDLEPESTEALLAKLDPELVASGRGSSAKPRARTSVASVFGELLLTAGVLVLLFVGWQMWFSHLILGAVELSESEALSKEWMDAPPPPLPDTVLQENGEVVFEPVIAKRPQGVEDFGRITIPSLGDSATARLAGGTTRGATLDRGVYGFYDKAAMPGDVGNFAVAAHRTSSNSAAPLRNIDKLRIGDAIIVEMKEGWYLYRFRSLEYVQPSRVQVLADVPQMPGRTTGERYITLTSCAPLYSLNERIIAYGIFERFQPRAEGPPAWLDETSS